jgi:hypothetical protein
MVLAAGFAELAAQLGVRGLADARDPVASVHAVLARFRVPWLLIFDNVPDLAAVAAFLPPAGPGRVLITSQNLDWAPAQGLDVPALDPRLPLISWSAGPVIPTLGPPPNWPGKWVGFRWRWSKLPHMCRRLGLISRST